MNLRLILCAFGWHDRRRPVSVPGASIFFGPRSCRHCGDQALPIPVPHIPMPPGAITPPDKQADAIIDLLKAALDRVDAGTTSPGDDRLAIDVIGSMWGAVKQARSDEAADSLDIMKHIKREAAERALESELELIAVRHTAPHNTDASPGNPAAGAHRRPSALRP